MCEQRRYKFVWKKTSRELPWRAPIKYVENKCKTKESIREAELNIWQSVS